MRLRPDVLVFLAILALAAYAVVWQTNSPAALVSPLAIGERVPDFRLRTVSGEEGSLSGRDGAFGTPDDWVGRKATVFYFWSVSCPCIDAIEDRMKSVLLRFPRARGFEYVAIDADPEDTREAVASKMGRLHAFYRMLLDPSQRTAALLGGTASGEVVVIDGDRRIRYRGAIDDDLKKPKRFHLMEVLEAIESGRAPETTQTPGYGCPFPGIEGVCASEVASKS